MLDGSNSGRAFESPLAPYLFGILVVIALALWLWGKYELSQPDDEYDSSDNKNE